MPNDELPPFNPLPLTADAVVFKQAGEAQPRTPGEPRKLSLDPAPIPDDWRQEPRRRRTQRSELKELLEIQAQLGIGDELLMEALGYSRNAITDWRKHGDCPAVAVIAAKYLLSQRQPPKAANYRYLLVAIASDGHIGTREIDQPQEFTFMGRTYLCWPVTGAAK